MITRNEKLAKRRDWWNENKNRLNKERREWNKKNNDWAKERQRIWRKKNKEHFNKWQRKYHKKNKKKHNKQNMETYYRHQQKYRLHQNEKIKIKRKKEKILTINHYSKEKNCCELCGIIDIDVLTIDHIDGNGTKHRKKIKEKHMPHWLIKNNFPDGFRILCMNCQFKERKRKNQFSPSNRIKFDSP